ncbi:MAG: hypothetical protein KC506_03615, partial [Nanoarchaeota archaeon]|nr:hypothetical protein [Nanoarchaeota archaeon]
MTNKREDMLLKVYLLRHQESVKGEDNSREYDADLAEAGKNGSIEVARHISKLGKIDSVLAGSLKRHKKTGEILIPERKIYQDKRLNAIPRTKFLETQNPRDIEETYDLARFSPSSDGLYHGLDAEGQPIDFNPATLG